MEDKQCYSYQDNQELIMEFQSGDMDALDAICRCNSGLVSKMARKYAAATSLPYDDFCQEWMIGLMQAAERFDPEREGAFSTYASWYFFRQCRNTRIRIPELSGFL